MKKVEKIYKGWSPKGISLFREHKPFKSYVRGFKLMEVGTLCDFGR